MSRVIDTANGYSELIYGEPTDNVDISIVIPTYNRVDTLRDAINSINNQNNIYGLIYQVIIVSNNPKFKIDGIRDIINKNKYCVYRNTHNIGMCGNINQCALLAKGEFVAYLHDDDLLTADYLSEIGRLRFEGKLNDIDCIIPNRFFLFTANGTTVFSRRSARHIQMKNIAQSILRLGKRIPELQKVSGIDEVRSQFNIYGGGPTCGILFRRETLLEANAFDPTYKYGFDSIFLFEFSEKFRTFLLNRYIGIYRTEFSASNSDDVQVDFFRTKYDTTINQSKVYDFVRKNKDLILYNFYLYMPYGAKSKIDKEWHLKKYSWIYIKMFRIKCAYYLFRNGLFRKEPLFISKSEG